MRTLFIISILFFSYGASFGQTHKLSAAKKLKIQIINYNIDQDPNRLPVLNFTILNKTPENIVLNRIGLNLIAFKKHPLSSSSNNGLESKVLTPIAGLDLDILGEPAEYIYDIKSPIEIAAKDAATIQIRIHYLLKNKCVVPSQVGAFKFILTFITYDNKNITSNMIELGD